MQYDWLHYFLLSQELCKLLYAYIWLHHMHGLYENLQTESIAKHFRKYCLCGSEMRDIEKIWSHIPIQPNDTQLEIEWGGSSGG